MNQPLLPFRRALALPAFALALLFSVLCPPSSAAEAKKSFDLPAGAAAETLKQFAAQAGREIVFAPEAVNGAQTKALRGELTPKEALEQLLADTGLVASQDAKTGAFAVKRDTGPNALRAAQTDSDRPVQNVKIEEGVVKMEEVEVTGSRIRGLLGEADFSPMVRFDRAEIEQLGITSMGEIGRLIPQAFSQNSYEGMGFGGQSEGFTPTGDGSLASAVSQRATINLRGMGTSNTLVLINGRRMARTGNSTGQDGYDLSSIPVAAIERIEVVTDGSSAIYGSDAVAGVINIILRENYSGTDVTLSYENTFDSDTAVVTSAITHGIRRGKLSLTLNASYRHRNTFAAVDRYFSATDDWTQLGSTTSFGLGTTITGSFNAGGIVLGPGFIRSVSGNLPGRTTPFALIPEGATGAARPAADYVSVAGNNFGVPAYTGDRAGYVNLISPQFTRTFGFSGSFDFRPSIRAYFSGGYDETRTHIEGMPVNYRNGIGISTPIPADYPGNPFGVPVRLNKTFWELGPIQGEKFTDNSTLRLASGLQGRFGADWRYDVGFSWNRATMKNENSYDPAINDIALNAAIVARSLVLFYDSNTSQPNDLNLLRSILRRADSRDTADTILWSASTDGPLPWLKLPAGPVRFAVGVERSVENISTTQAFPEDPRVNFRLVGDFERALSSAFAETRVPLLGTDQNFPLFRRLDATAAIRYDRYSDAGGDFSPRYGLTWRPFSWMLLRGTRNHAFRAPSVQSLYRPVTHSLLTNIGTGFTDPVTNEQVVGSLDTLRGGNPDLQPERSISDNFGVVLNVPGHWFKGLSLSADLIQISYTDKIAPIIGLQETAVLAPERLIRDATGHVITVDLRPINLSKDVLEMVDFALDYQRSTPWGNFRARAGLTDYRKVESTRVPGAVPLSTVHQRPTRMTWLTSWSKGPYAAGVSGFYQDTIWFNSTRTTILFGSAIEWNVNFAYDFGWKDGELNSVMESRRTGRNRLLSGTKLSFNVNNVLNTEPPHRSGRAGFGVTDPRMARYVLTLRKSF